MICHFSVLLCLAISGITVWNHPWYEGTCGLSPKKREIIYSWLEFRIYILHVYICFLSFLNLADVKFHSWEIQMVLDKHLLMLSCGKHAWLHPVPILRRENAAVTSDKVNIHVDCVSLILVMQTTFLLPFLRNVMWQA